jgi:hypothetical protein
MTFLVLSVRNLSSQFSFSSAKGKGDGGISEAS